MEHIQRVKVHLYAGGSNAVKHIDHGRTLLPFDNRRVPVDDESNGLVANVREALEVPPQIVTQLVLADEGSSNRDVFQDPIVGPPAKDPLEVTGRCVREDSFNNLSCG